MPVQIHIDYWYRELKAKILLVVNDAVVTGAKGKTSSFEVKVNDVLVFSKLEQSGFPDFDEIVEIVVEVNEGGVPRQANKSNKSCIIS